METKNPSFYSERGYDRASLSGSRVLGLAYLIHACQLGSRRQLTLILFPCVFLCVCVHVCIFL